MNTDLQLYRAVAYLERAIAMSYALPYALRQTAQVYQVPPGQLAELLLAKRIECDRARVERDAMTAADREIEAGNWHKNAEELRERRHRAA